ncbi:MAG: hypothetical protein ACLU9S_18155 [Oscillospiraceae bacterium]
MPGDVVYVYENGVEAGYTKASLPVARGGDSSVFDLRNIRVTRQAASWRQSAGEKRGREADFLMCTPWRRLLFAEAHCCGCAVCPE